MFTVQPSYLTVVCSILLAFGGYDLKFSQSASLLIYSLHESRECLYCKQKQVKGHCKNLQSWLVYRFGAIYVSDLIFVAFGFLPQGVIVFIQLTLNVVPFHLTQCYASY